MYSGNCSGCSFSYTPSNCSKFYNSISGSDLNLEKTVEYSAPQTKGESYSVFNFEQRVNQLYDSRDYEKQPVINSTAKEKDNKYFSNHQDFNPMSFLNPERPKVKFISNIEELKPIITETFEKLVDEKFPDNISIRICKQEELKKIHESSGGVWVPTIQGFSLNRKGRGINEIFVKQDALDSMMLTIGHELGHVMTPTLENPVNEEAKAFAFSLAWIKTIKKFNIGDLAPNICPNPEKNGLHDRAFNFVVNLLKEGRSAFHVFKEIAKGEFSSNQIIECEVGN